MLNDKAMMYARKAELEHLLLGVFYDDCISKCGEFAHWLGEQVKVEKEHWFMKEAQELIDIYHGM